MSEKYFDQSKRAVAIKAETTKYGVDGTAESISTIADGRYALQNVDFVWNPTHTRNTRKLGMAGLNGNSIGSVKISETNEWSAESPLYFDDDGLLTIIASGMGEYSMTDVGGGLFDHTFTLGDNTYDDTATAYSGSAERHFTAKCYDGLNIVTMQSCKPSSLSFSLDFTADEPITLSANGNAYVMSIEASGSLPTAWDSRIERSAEGYANSMIAAGGICTPYNYIRPYATTGNIDEAANLVRIKSAKIDPANNNSAERNSGTGVGVKEGVHGELACTVEFVVEFGPDDADEGIRDRQAEILAGTCLQYYGLIQNTDGKFFKVFIPKIEMTGDIPPTHAVDASQITITYKGNAVIANETLTGTFAGLHDKPFRVIIRSAVDVPVIVSAA